MPELVMDLDFLPKRPLTDNGNGRHSFSGDGTFNEDNMDHLDRIADQVSDLRADVATLTSKVDSFTDLLTLQVTHRIEEMKSSQAKQGKRLGDLETWHSITADREARNKWARATVQALVTLVAGAALLKSFGLA